jgi:GT2 family glycosyltransferase
MLSRLLESLRQLTYPRRQFELIVVGGPHDRGRDVVESFRESADFPVHYCIVRADMLGSASFKRNGGAEVARGDILAFTDDDCVVHRDWLTAAVPFFQAPEVGGVEGAVEIPKPTKPTLTYRGSLRLTQPGGYQTCSMFYRKSVFAECRGFDLFFPYYLEDTDLAYTVLERGYAIPFASGAIVAHPLQRARPLKLLTMARTVERMPYLFAKHRQLATTLRTVVKPFNRSHYVYLALYVAALSVGFVEPGLGFKVLGLGLCTLLGAHLAHDFWGLDFSVNELALTALCYPIVPVLRLFHWSKGLAKIWCHPGHSC